MVEAEDVVLAEDHPRARLQHDRAVHLSTVDETYRSVLRIRKIQDQVVQGLYAGMGESLLDLVSRDMTPPAENSDDSFSDL